MLDLGRVLKRVFPGKIYGSDQDIGAAPKVMCLNQPDVVPHPAACLCNNHHQSEVYMAHVANTETIQVCLPAFEVWLPLKELLLMGKVFFYAV